MSDEMKKAVDDGWTKNAFNQYVSDLISVHRTLPDPRDAWCKDEARYLTNLPKTDVIICFHNEAWTVLLRTVHSVLDRSPEHLIGKIILVDDYSDMREFGYDTFLHFTWVLIVLSLYYSSFEEAAGGLLCCLSQSPDNSWPKARGSDPSPNFGCQPCQVLCSHLFGFPLRVHRRWVENKWIKYAGSLKVYCTFFQPQLFHLSFFGHFHFNLQYCQYANCQN